MYLLETKDLIKTYKDQRVVNGVNIVVEKGEIVGLLGANGAGKTTTFYMIVGLIRPQSGKVFYHKKDITTMPMYKRARNGISYLSQEPSIFRKLTLEQNIMIVLETMNLTYRERKKRCEKLLSDFKIDHLAKHKAFTLSGGERRRLEICRALINNPSFILLDEPFSGVDPIAVADIQQIISELKDQGLSILLTDHNVRETLNITDRSYIIYKGEILVEGEPQYLVENDYAKRFYLGDNFALE
jgi:lipopolysaccharide export system ATP-binding protein